MTWTIFSLSDVKIELWTYLLNMHIDNEYTINSPTHTNLTSNNNNKFINRIINWISNIFTTKFVVCRAQSKRKFTKWNIFSLSKQTTRCRSTVHHYYYFSAIQFVQKKYWDWEWNLITKKILFLFFFFFGLFSMIAHT